MEAQKVLEGREGGLHRTDERFVLYIQSTLAALVLDKFQCYLGGALNDRIPRYRTLWFYFIRHLQIVEFILPEKRSYKSESYSLKILAMPPQLYISDSSPLHSFKNAPHDNCSPPVIIFIVPSIPDVPATNRDRHPLHRSRFEETKSPCFSV